MILNKEFRTALQDNPFASGNTFSLITPKETEFFVLPGIKRVPMIFIANRILRTAENIMYVPHSQLRGRILAKAKVQEIMSYAPMLLKVKYATKTLLAGKGMLCFFDEETEVITPVFVAIVPDKEDWEDEEVILVISRSAMQNPENRLFNALIVDFISDCKGDVFYTNDVMKFIGQDIILPKFGSMRQKKEYANNLINACFVEVKRQNQNISTTNEDNPF